MMKLVIASIRLGLIGLFCLWQGGPAAAQVCGADYVIKERETLAEIALRVYGSRSQWTAIFYANQDRLGTNATLLVPGLAITIPCIGGQTPQAAPSIAAPQATAAPTEAAPKIAAPSGAVPATPGGFELSTMVRRIEFLTADGFPPFTGRTLANGGLILDLLGASMDLIKQQSKGGFDYQISWVNDWSAHLNPLLITRAFDVGIPWVKPDCSNPAALDRNSQYKCQKFFFSDPFYENVSVLFVRKDSPISFASDDEVIGKTVCRTKGWSTADLDKGGRNWLKDGKITLMQPQTQEDCFRLLDSGTVDAVVVPDLTGRAIASVMGLSGRVRATERPVTIETMHAMVAKTHPNARTILYYINSSLAKLRESGAYDRIVEKHLEQFWESQEGGLMPSPTAAPMGSPHPAPPATAERSAGKQTPR